MRTEQQKLFLSHVGMFIQVWMEKNVDTIVANQTSGDVAAAVIHEVFEAAVEAAEGEDYFGVAVVNVEAICQKAQDFDTTVPGFYEDNSRVEEIEDVVEDTRKTSFDRVSDAMFYLSGSNIADVFQIAEESTIRCFAGYRGDLTATIYEGLDGVEVWYQ